MSGNNNQGSPEILLMVIIALVCALAWFFWHATGNFFLHYVFRWLRYGELWTINLFTHNYGHCLDWLRAAPVMPTAPGLYQPSPLMMGLTNACFGNYLLHVPADETLRYYFMTIPPIMTLGAETGIYFRWPMAAILIYVGGKELLFSPRSKFKVKHTLETFIQAQVKIWPVISPIVKFNPSKSGRILGTAIPDKLPMFAEALSPEEWIAWNRIPVVNGVPDRDASRRAFIQQLGPRWTGIDAAPLHYRALFAAAALKGAQKREQSDNFLGRLALCWNDKKGFRPDSKIIDEINKIIKDPELGGRLLPIADLHAWRTTALLGALKWARSQGGVLAPAQFLWIRAEDRPLWYPLNNLGRRSFHSEGAGAMAHFMAELAAGKALPIPRVETAIVTLNTYLHDPDKRPTTIPPLAVDAKR